LVRVDPVQRGVVVDRQGTGTGGHQAGTRRGAQAGTGTRRAQGGGHASVSDIARAEKLDRTYFGDVLRLTLLAPDIVVAIMDGRQPAELGVHVLREGFPVEWGEQRRGFGT